MAGEWREVTIGDLVWLHDQQITPASAPAELFYHYSIPAYDSGQRPALETGSAIGSNKFVVPRGAVLVSKLNPQLPRVWAPDIPDKARAVASTEFLVLSPRDGVDRRFLKYLMLSPAVRSAMEARVTGTSGSHQRVRPSDLLSISVDIPVDLQEQRAIAHILGTLDDKIELNRRMSETLEAMARALFKAWFVDFEPVRAKMEGRWQRGQSLPGLPAHLYDLFPTRLVHSELGEIPEGWEVARVDDLCARVENGGTPRRMEPIYWGGSIAWFKTGELTDGPLLASEETITQEGLSSSSCKLWPIGTILIALYASPTVGRLGILEVPAAANQACSALLARPEYGNLFLFYTLLATRERLQQIAVGAAQQNINQQAVRDHKVIVPPAAIARAFHDSAEALYRRRVGLISESRTLAALRDALLPKLIRGEIRVKDAERFVQDLGGEGR
jgi:type I restriction enzyme S subunit